MATVHRRRAVIWVIVLLVLTLCTFLVLTVWGANYMGLDEYLKGSTFGGVSLRSNASFSDEPTEGITDVGGKVTLKFFDTTYEMRVGEHTITGDWNAFNELIWVWVDRIDGIDRHLHDVEHPSCLRFHLPRRVADPVFVHPIAGGRQASFFGGGLILERRYRQGEGLKKLILPVVETRN